MIVLRPGTVLFWEAARLPFNALMLVLASVAFEPLFSRVSAETAWSYVLDGKVMLAFVLANAIYSLVHPLDRWLQSSPFQRRESAGRIALWGGLALLSGALVQRAALTMVGMVFF